MITSLINLNDFRSVRYTYQGNPVSVPDLLERTLEDVATKPGECDTPQRFAYPAKKQLPELQRLNSVAYLPRGMVV